MKTRLIEIVAILSLAAVVALPFLRIETIKSHLHEIIAGLLVFVAVLILFHQRIEHGFWYHLQGIWNHEALEACGIVLAVGLLLGKYLAKT